MAERILIDIATTGGPATVRAADYDEEAKRSSMVLFDRSYVAAGVDTHFDGCDRKLRAALARLGVATPEGGLILEVDQPIDAGESWQLGLAVLHLVMARGALATTEAEATRLIWATGAIGTSSWTTRAVEAVPTKLARSAERFADLAARGIAVEVLVPEAQIEEARSAAPPGIVPRPVGAIADLVAEFAAPPAPAPPAVLAPEPAPPPTAPARRGWTALAGAGAVLLLAGAGIWLAAGGLGSGLPAPAPPTPEGSQTAGPTAPAAAPDLPEPARAVAAPVRPSAEAARRDARASWESYRDIMLPGGRAGWLERPARTPRRPASVRSVAEPEAIRTAPDARAPGPLPAEPRAAAAERPAPDRPAAAPALEAPAGVTGRPERPRLLAALPVALAAPPDIPETPRAGADRAPAPPARTEETAQASHAAPRAAPAEPAAAAGPGPARLPPAPPGILSPQPPSAPGAPDPPARADGPDLAALGAAPAQGSGLAVPAARAETAETVAAPAIATAAAATTPAPLAVGLDGPRARVVPLAPPQPEPGPPPRLAAADLGDRPAAPPDAPATPATPAAPARLAAPEPPAPAPETAALLARSVFGAGPEGADRGPEPVVAVLHYAGRGRDCRFFEMFDRPHRVEALPLDRLEREIRVDRTLCAFEMAPARPGAALIAHAVSPAGARGIRIPPRRADMAVRAVLDATWLARPARLTLTVTPRSGEPVEITYVFVPAAETPGRRGVVPSPEEGAGRTRPPRLDGRLFDDFPDALRPEPR